MASLPSRLHQSRGAMDRTADADISSAAADVGQISVDIGVGWLRMVFQECNGRHDLSGLAVTALRDILGKPGLLHGVLRIRRQAFDGCDALVGNVPDLNATGADGLAVYMNGAGTALRNAAAEFRTGHSEFVADDPKQWRLRFYIQRIRLSV